MGETGWEKQAFDGEAYTNICRAWDKRIEGEPHTIHANVYKSVHQT